MSDEGLSAEAAKLLAARKAAAEELRALDGADRPITDHGVMRLANARLYESAITMRMLAGEVITAGEFKVAADMVEAARTVAKVMPTVNVQFCSSVVGIYRCKHCGQQNEIDNYEKPKPPPSRPVTIDGTVIERGHGSTAVAALSAPVEANAEPPTRRHPGSIHDQPGARMRVHHEPWRGHVGTVDNP